MDRRKDIQEFLTSRRSRLTPEQAGLPTFGDRRRVHGLRREEVAMLAGVSVDYYARLERGHLAGASDTVLEAVARALKLDEAEYQHLLDLARTTPAAPAARRSTRPKQSGLRPAVRTIIDGLTGIPAYVRTPTMDILAANELCQALYDGALDNDKLPVNLARFLFLDPHARDIYLEWEQVADDLAGSLRTQAGRDPRNRALSDLVGELSTRSDDFATRWAKQNVRLHRTARKTLHNRIVGDIQFTGNALDLAGDDLVLVAYTADPGSNAEDQLQLLISWIATRRAVPHASTSTDISAGG
ncbi:helix-turn-helix domain-containing protein [Microlunatus parietis]|uniref:Transcriptional regulator with XRE-family HTH domain n=1 Tax=Microlunatus parietis TaxID=682979 RepID=A0A7Y9LCI9_9ACTN|nr:helix-turn-helix transcriptional regulator [Microlunatus parietis]NYE71878.1 transcriptional regulator with XRE-family HTH domain [Microlunatus parietis]